MSDGILKNTLFGKMRFIVLIIGIFLAGWFMRSVFSPKQQSQVAEATTQTQTIWTCSMHPQIRQDHPGKCPICGMTLIPVSQAGGLPASMIEFSPEAVKMMAIETSPVERKFVTATVNMVGKVDYDETRIKNIAAWVPGRIRPPVCGFYRYHRQEGGPSGLFVQPPASQCPE